MRKVIKKIMEMELQEKTRAAAAPRKPKKGAVSSPLNVDIFDDLNFKKTPADESEVEIRG